MNKQKFDLHLPGLLKILAEHLYSTRIVGVRELIQNAHDSCTRRAVEDTGVKGYKPRIDFTIDRPNGTLIIRDNGSGLTDDEIRSYLATIGRSYTSELSEKLSVLSAAEAASLIGQFGMGFLSAFMLASEVTVTTQSYQTPGQAWRWFSSGDEFYDLQPAASGEIGTTITLKLKPAASFLLQKQVLIDAIIKYADFLSIPIYLDAEPAPINIRQPPWQARNPQEMTAQYISQVFNQASPLLILFLHDHSLDVGGDELKIPLGGFLFVPPFSTASVREFGDVSVYIKSMFICEDERGLLPPWGRFVRGVVESAALAPTASREGLHQDDMYDMVRQAIEEQLVAGLKQVAQSDPERWRSIVRGHADVITGWAVMDNRFFDEVADILSLRTSRGAMTIREYLELTGSKLYYVSRELGSLQEQMLGEGFDVPVIDGSWFAVKPFLEKYAARHQDISLVQMDGEARLLIRPVQNDAYQHVLAYYRQQGITARMSTFKPASVPGLILYPQDADLIMQARNALDGGDIPNPIAKLISDYVDQASARLSDDDDIKGVLYLNVACSLIARLADRPAEHPGFAPALTLVYQIGRLFGGRMLTPMDAAQAFQAITDALESIT